MKNNLVRVALLMDKAGGRRETVLAEAGGEPDTFVVHSIPAFTYGLGLKDTIRLLDRESGNYEIIERGKQIVVRLYVNGSLEQPPVKTLIDTVVSLGGEFEVGKNAMSPGGKSLLLIALDLAIGFEKIEALMQPLAGAGHQWEYGNIYDATGNPLNWW